MTCLFHWKLNHSSTICAVTISCYKLNHSANVSQAEMWCHYLPFFHRHHQRSQISPPLTNQWTPHFACHCGLSPAQKTTLKYKNFVFINAIKIGLKCPEQQNLEALEIIISHQFNFVMSLVFCVAGVSEKSQYPHVFCSHHPHDRSRAALHCCLASVRTCLKC